MSVEKYRIVKESSNYTIIPNNVVQNLKDYGALGLYAYFLSLPDNWIFHKSQLAEHGDIGRDKLNKYLNVLKKCKLIEITHHRNEKGQFSEWDLHVKNGSEFSYPQKDEPLTEKPSTEKPLTENPHLQKKYIYKENKELQKEHVELPDWLPEKLWAEFKQFRKEIKKPLTILAEKKAIEKLKKLRFTGHDVVEIINNSIVNGWSGLFEIKKPSNVTPFKINESKSTVKFFEPGHPDYDRIHG